MRAIVVVTTVGNEQEAQNLAEELVARRHAACINIVPVLRSVYRWQGKICQDSEFMLVIKTRSDEFPAIEAAIRELHSYDLPEILSFRVHDGEAGFLQWISDSVDKSKEDETESAEDSR